MRDNNGVPAKVKSNVGRGSVERGGGMVGTDADSWNGGKNLFNKRAGSEMDNGGTGGPVLGHAGTEKNMGGVGDYGMDADKNQKGYFGTEH